MRRTVEILFVCTGNTCRSPLAEVIAARRLEVGGASVQARSAGTDAWDGEPASVLAQQVAAEVGLDLTAHRARRVTREMLAGAALVLAMAPAHVDALRRLAPAAASRVHLLRDYAEGVGKGAAVIDPIGGDLGAYRRTLQELQALVEASVERFLTEVASREA